MVFKEEKIVDRIKYLPIYSCQQLSLQQELHLQEEE